MADKNKPKAELDPDYIHKESNNITEEDVRTVLKKAKTIIQKFSSIPLLKRHIKDARLMLELVVDYWNGYYRTVPWFIISAVVFALLYVLNPLDLIADFLPVIGVADDVTVVVLCLRMIDKDLQRYKTWKVQ